MESNLTSIGGVVNSKEYSMQGGSCQRQVKCQAQGNLHEIAWSLLGTGRANRKGSMLWYFMIAKRQAMSPAYKDK